MNYILVYAASGATESSVIESDKIKQQNYHQT